MARYGMTIPLDGIPLAQQRDWIRELADLGYTDLWSAEAGATDGWRKYVGAVDDPHAAVVGLDRFGESAPGGVLFKHFGFTIDNVVAAVKTILP